MTSFSPLSPSLHPLHPLHLLMKIIPYQLIFNHIMADNYLEKHMDDYQKRKREWERKKKHLTSPKRIASSDNNRSVESEQKRGYRDGE